MDSSLTVSADRQSVTSDVFDQSSTEIEASSLCGDILEESTEIQEPEVPEKPKKRQSLVKFRDKVKVDCIRHQCWELSYL